MVLSESRTLMSVTLDPGHYLRLKKLMVGKLWKSRMKFKIYGLIWD